MSFINNLVAKELVTKIIEMFQSSERIRRENNERLL